MDKIDRFYSLYTQKIIAKYLFLLRECITEFEVIETESLPGEKMNVEVRVALSNEEVYISRYEKALVDDEYYKQIKGKRITKIALLYRDCEMYICAFSWDAHLMSLPSGIFDADINEDGTCTKLKQII